ncbi:hypothetical protein [Methylocystis bryophila]|uniref:Uncharacterized protein n=1 Tax=Methylocystis bryophila TaxID=655015 RepID=A0A1W6MUR6_9HYPH|nr:hypothetical protein [Methylocystis bryophila]ARN81350.1 hypothetical protein B1812_09980 [Methylocystis bryophila]BDV37334.1 hypothetical protein DSM21852_05870 [Methylocystis bryophila]
MRVIAHLTAVLLAATAAAEPLNYDACEGIQDSREYAHCIATLGAAGGKKTAAPPAQAAPAAAQPQAEAPEKTAATPEKEAPAPRRVAVRARGGRIVYHAAPRSGGRVHVQVGGRGNVVAKPASRRGRRR